MGMTRLQARNMFLKLGHNLKYSTVELRLKKLIVEQKEGNVEFTLYDKDILSRFKFILSNIYGPNIAKLVLELFQHEKTLSYYIETTNDSLITAAGSNSQYSDKTIEALISDGTIGIAWQKYACLLQAAKGGSYQAFRVFNTMIPTLDLSVRNNEVTLEIYKQMNSDSMYHNNAKLIWDNFFKNNSSVIAKAMELNQVELLPANVKDIFMF